MTGTMSRLLSAMTERQALGPSGQTPASAFAQQLLTNQPGGLGNLASPIIAAMLLKRDQEQRQRIEGEDADMFRQALKALQGGVKEFRSPDTGEVLVPGQQPGAQAFAQVLAGNPRTAPIAANVMADALQQNRPKFVNVPNVGLVRTQGDTAETVIEARPDEFETIRLNNGVLAQRNKRTNKISSLPQTRPPSARQARIQSLMDQGLDQTTAANVADGFIQILPDALGRPVAVNVVTNEQTPLRVSSVQTSQQPASAASQVTQPTQSPEPANVPQSAVNVVDGTPSDSASPPALPTDRPPLTAFEAVQGGTGILPAIQGAISSTAGQFFEGAQFPGVAQRRAFFAGLQQQAIRAFSTGGKTPVVEQERIANIFAKLGALESEADAVASLQTAVQMIDQRIAQNERAMRAPNTPTKDIPELARGITELRNLKEVVGVPLPGQVQQNGPQQTGEDFGDLTTDEADELRRLRGQQ